MKRQIRCGVFETNSSSVHSLTMCSIDEYEKWKNEEILFWQDESKFATKQEIIEELKQSRWSYNNSLKYPDVNWEDEDEVDELFSDERIQTYEEFFDNDWFETYSQTHTTPKGDTVVGFGYYGHD